LKKTGRTAADVRVDMLEVMAAMDYFGGGWTETMDLEEWLANAEELRSLYFEAYEIEKKRLEEEQRVAEELASVYDSLADSLHQQIVDLTTGGQNPADIFERLLEQEKEVNRLRTLYLAEDDPKKRAGYAQSLADSLKDYLTLAEEAYSRPSPAYANIYRDIIDELQGMELDSRSVAEQQRDIMNNIDLQLTGIKDILSGQLIALNTKLNSANTELDNIQQTYLDAIKGDVSDIEELLSPSDISTGGIGDVGETSIEKGMNASLETKVRPYLLAQLDMSAKIRDLLEDVEWNTRPLLQKIFGDGDNTPKLHGGNFVVPYTGFKAELAKGEVVQTPEQYRSTQPLTVNLGDITINSTGNDNDGKKLAEEFIEEVKHEIEFGTLGEAIRERVA
jgi:hypothetical protein